MRTLIVSVMLITLVMLFCFSTTGLAVIKDKGLVAYYNFDEGGGKEVTDLSGNDNNGTFKGDFDWVAGKYGKALAIEYPSKPSINERAGETTHVVIVPDDKTLDISPAVTIAAWAKLSRLPTGGQCPSILTKRAKCGPGNYQLFWRGNPNGKMCYWGGGADSCTAKCVIKADTWHHVVSTMDFANKTIKFYLDGVNCDTQPRPTPLAPNDSPLYIGTDSCNNCGYEGTITLDEVAIFNRALSKNEVEAAMKEGLGNLGVTAVQASDKLSTTWASIKREISR